MPVCGLCVSDPRGQCGDCEFMVTLLDHGHSFCLSDDANMSIPGALEPSIWIEMLRDPKLDGQRGH